MADYSWVVLQMATTDEEILSEVRRVFNADYEESYSDQGITVFKGETSYGLAYDAENILIERGVAYSRYSDGKYDYDGDEAHWKPGMDSPRTFPRLDNGGRVFTEADFRKAYGKTGLTSSELGDLIREWFMFPPAVEVRYQEVRQA